MTPPSANLHPDAPAAPNTTEFGGPPRSRAESVYTMLKADIAEFRLVPGDRFTENEVCERLGVSRTPVRQALFRMKQEGIVEVLFRSGWRVLPFDFRKFEELYDLRMVLETEAVARICAGSADTDRASLDALAAIWLVAPEDRLQDMAQVGALDEAFHCTLVSAAGNAEMAHVHREVSERIRIIRRLDFTKPARIAATYDEHGKILQAILAKRGDEACRMLRAHIGASQLEVRKITLHEVYLARNQARQAQEAVGGQD